ncbi:CAR1 transcription factor-like [Chenopodium quinoa]|uniref:CAR1 transcription factor-like n=1 Tax=Chenopodium quinoa TaxID=63459 RepID=UPI000B773759|nr:CAR1 transcription factor-like [Chenopodium quinoa]
MSSNQSLENRNYEDHDCNEEERELEEALSLSDLPICSSTGNQDDGGGVKDEENKNEEDDLEFDFDFGSGSLVGSSTAPEGEMCAADEVFSGGLMLPYRNSVISMSGLRSVSRSESMDRRTFGSRCSSSRSSSIRSHYSATSSSGSSSCSNNTTISAKTVPLVSKSSNKVVQNQFHSYPSPKPQILGTGPRFSAYTASPIGKKSKMWDVLKLGLVRTPEIELQDLKLCHHRTNNFGKTFTIPRNNSTGSSSSSSSNRAGNNNNDRPRKSCEFVSEMQRRKSQLHEINNGGFFKSCKCTIGVIEPIPTTPKYNTVVKSGYFGSNKFGKGQVLNEDKNSAQKKHHLLQQQQQQQQQQQRRNNQIRQEKKVTSHHHHHEHRTFEWLKNLSHASILNTSNS